MRVSVVIPTYDEASSIARVLEEIPAPLVTEVLVVDAGSTDGLREMTYGWAVELVTRGAMHGYRVMEVPVSYHPRIGVSKISGTLRGSIGAAWCILAGIVKNRLRPATSPAEPGPAA